VGKTINDWFHYGKALKKMLRQATTKRFIDFLNNAQRFSATLFFPFFLKKLPVKSFFAVGAPHLPVFFTLSVSFKKLYTCKIFP
jgi:hypothetical protein